MRLGDGDGGVRGGGGGRRGRGRGKGGGVVASEAAEALRSMSWCRIMAGAMDKDAPMVGGWVCAGGGGCAVHRQLTPSPPEPPTLTTYLLLPPTSSPRPQPLPPPPPPSPTPTPSPQRVHEKALRAFALQAPYCSSADKADRRAGFAMVRTRLETLGREVYGPGSERGASLDPEYVGDLLGLVEECKGRLGG